MDIEGSVTEIENVRLGKYYGVFTVTFVLLFIAMVLFVFISKINIGSAVANIAEMAICVLMVSNSFFKDHNRYPGDKEKKKMAVIFTIINLLISFSILFISSQFNTEANVTIEQLKGNLIVFILILFAVSLINYFVILYFFNMFAKIHK